MWSNMCKYTNIRNEYEQYIVEFQLFRAYYISVKFEKIRYRVSSGKKYILLNFFVTSILKRKIDYIPISTLSLVSCHLRLSHLISLGLVS